MDGDVILLIKQIEKLFDSQTSSINLQLAEMKGQALEAGKKVEDIRGKIEVLIVTERDHYRDCPVNGDVRDIKRVFYKTVEDIEGQIKEISYILEFKKLLQTAKFMLEWKIVFIPAFVVMCVLSVIGGVQGYEATREYLHDQVIMREQIKSNTGTLNAIEDKEVKSQLKK